MDQYEAALDETEQEPIEAQEELSDDDLLRYVWDERRAAIGFEQDEELVDQRTKALNYRKGYMPDVPSVKNRSSAVSTDVADAIHTVLPDLVEIFTGGEDVATFQPVGEEDEEAARQETDYINHVVVDQNNGFMLFYTAFDDACTSKTGIFKWWWEETQSPRSERFEGMSVVEVENAIQWAQENGAQLENLAPEGEGEQTVYSYTLEYPSQGKVCIETVVPEDFSVARDTVKLSNATYCAMRSRPRAQDLIADGYDAELVEQLPNYGSPSSQDQEALARDTAGENSQVVAGSSELRIVEIVEHVIRIVNAEGEPVIWRVVTGDNEGVMLLRERIEEVPFAAITPYPVAHRFYGRSLADLLLEVQRIKTALTRMLLDSGYFALNQRLEVATGQGRANEFTIGDLLRNEPGIPVRSTDGQSVRPIGSPGLSFDAAGALEYFSTVGEGRTGVVRNAQGLNPDTLHDTAKGAMQLMNAAQKRTRMIARIFAETGVKDMFLGVHALLRRHGSASQKVRLRGQWVQTDPSQWGERKDMTIEIGVGSGGRELAMQQGSQLLALLEKLIQAQGGLEGPFVTAANLFTATKRYIEQGLGYKSADSFISDPAKAPPKANVPPPPDPEMIAAQQKAELEKYKVDQQLALDQRKLDAEIIQAREQMAAEIQLKREQMVTEARLKGFEIATGQRAGGGFGGGVQFGGDVG